MSAVEVAEVMVEVMMVVNILALFIIFTGVLPKFPREHDLCCSFLVNVLFSS